MVIAMLGNVFSPRRAKNRRRGKLEAADALDFCTMNVSLRSHGADGPSRWALTEHSRAAVTRTREELAIGSSRMAWSRDGSLTVHIDERCSPFGEALRGRIVFRPEITTDHAIALDDRGRHSWFPYAPAGELEVQMDEPRMRFVGRGYFDANAGTAPLEDDFRAWTWSRVPSRRGVEVSYDVTTKDGRSARRGLTFGEGGDVHLHKETEDGPLRSLARTRFGLQRHAPRGVALVRTLEDGPFYARSLVRGADGGLGIHETVSLDRFVRSWVRFLLTFRMRRAT